MELGYARDDDGEPRRERVSAKLRAAPALPPRPQSPSTRSAQRDAALLWKVQRLERTPELYRLFTLRASATPLDRCVAVAEMLGVEAPWLALALADLPTLQAWIRTGSHA